MLRSRTHGWHDLSIWVQGGGIQPGYEAILRFNGRTYPSDVMDPPAIPARKHLPGAVVISRDMRSIPFYP